MGSGLSVVNDINDINDINGTIIDMHRVIMMMMMATDNNTNTTRSVDEIIQKPSLSIALLRELSSSSSSSSLDMVRDNMRTIETMDDIDEYLGNANGNTDAVNVNANVNDDDDDERYLLSVDCCPDAESALMLIQRVAALPRVTGISSSTSNLIIMDDSGVSSIKGIDLQHIQTLNLSNNTTIRSVKTLALALPPSLLSSLLVLDLSYCTLSFSHLCFYPLVNLRKLTMDGCGISDTLVVAATSTDDDGDGDDDASTTIGYFDSIFSGLINMQELSLKENELGSSSSLRGLGYYSLPCVDSKLHSVWIDDNPLCESSKTLTSSVSMLISAITSLVSVNDKNYRTTATATVDVVAVLRKGDQRIDRSSGGYGSGSGSGLDSMEKEYLAALKGERETTVVA